ncbi:MAG TPA: malectin domain-containing carbohydrate-binding protein [Bryobacteraceae bacterium]|nr:malectin domain-containing carbohydrate-binding protein [Bryobacteraceae bacterium]
MVTPATGAVFEGGTITLTSQKPVTWALAAGSYGTLTINSSTSATYQAPSSVTANNVFRGCQTAPNDAVWNVPIDSLPLDPNSAAWIQTMSPYSISLAPAWGTNVVNNLTPKVNETFVYTPNHNGLFTVPAWPALKRESGVFVSDKNGSDHHIMSINSDSCAITEIYNNYFSPRSCGSGTCTATSGLQYNWSTYALPTGSTAAGNVPYTPLVLHLSEIKAQAINHALAFDLGNCRISAGNNPTSYWPSNNTYGSCGTRASAPPYGARFRLKSSFVINTQQFNLAAQTILAALKQYGMFLTDAGIDGQIYTDSDLREDADVQTAINQIANAKIGFSNFEAVDESSFMVNPNSAEVNPANGIETPDGYAVVTATDVSNPNSKTLVPIAVEANYPTVNSPTMYIVAGTPGHTIPSGFRAGHYPGTHWSLVSGPGSITTNGIYTPPSSVSAPTPAEVQETGSNADEVTSVYIMVLPKGVNPDGSIRIDVGHTGSIVDANGNTWLGDQAFEAEAEHQVSYDYPNWPDQSNPEIKIYQTSTYTYGGDLLYSFAVPNGNYKVRLMFGEPYNGCNPCTTFNPTWHAPLFLEANGQIGAHNYDFGKPIGYKYATPVDAFIPVQVTNGTLYVALRANVPDANAVPGVHPSPLLNGLEIIPDSSAPYLTIDTQQTTSVAAGSTLQLYAVGWYMSNSVNWSIASGPGSIDQNGLYTAPSSAGSSPQTVVIQAASTVNGATATATLTIPAGQ